MRDIHYFIADPTGNITALVCTHVDTLFRPFVASMIMKREPKCEQVGFVGKNENGENFLEMAGGEFCGNASMAAAALICERENIPHGQSRTVHISVSGASVPVEVKVNNGGDKYSCEVRMPRPERIDNIKLAYCDGDVVLPAVFFPGITHIIVQRAPDRDKAEEYIKKWCRDISADGLGIMFFDREKNTLTPLVFIPESDTLFWESSCASGTSAVGAYFAALKNGNVDIKLREPGGILRVSAKKNGDIKLFGSVAVISENSLLVDIDKTRRFK